MNPILENKLLWHGGGFKINFLFKRTDTQNRDECSALWLWNSGEEEEGSPGRTPLFELSKGRVVLLGARRRPFDIVFSLQDGNSKILYRLSSGNTFSWNRQEIPRHWSCINFPSKMRLPKIRPEQNGQFSKQGNWSKGVIPTQNIGRITENEK